MTPRTLRPRLALALGLVALLAIGAGEGPRIESVTGAVEIASGEPAAWRAARSGDAISPGDAVRTGHDGRAELVLGTGTVRLYPNSMLRVPLLGSGDDASERVRLERGRSLFDVLKRKNGRFEVETPEVVVSVKGTRFGVDVSQPLAQVAVFRGLVGVREISQTLAFETLVREGFAAVGGANAPIELMLNRANDPWDGWAAGRVEALLDERAARPLSLPKASASATPPAKQAILEARRAARVAAEPDVVAIALERNPALRERMKTAAKRERMKADVPKEGGSVGTLAEVPKVETLADVPKLANAQIADAAALRDTVVDSRAFKREVQQNLIETVATGQSPMSGGGSSSNPGGGGASLPFTIETGGPGVQIMAEGVLYEFSMPQIAQFVAGTQTLPQPLMDVLTSSGSLPVGEILQLIQDLGQQ